MNVFASAIDSVVKNAETSIPELDTDFRDKDGFLVCGKCKTRKEMDVDFPFFDGSGETVKKRVRVLCSCMQKERDEEERLEKMAREAEARESRRRSSFMDASLLDATFDRFRETQKNSRNLKLCRRYAEHFDEMIAKNQGLLLYGDVGTGKSFAAGCIANYLIDHRVPVLMTSFVKLLDSDDEEMPNKIARAKLLIIDDLGAERDTSYALEKVYDIIDSRYRSKLPLILTTNLTLDEMKLETDTRYARIYDRIFEMCYPMQFTGTSWRKTEAARRFKEMEKFLEENDG